MKHFIKFIFVMVLSLSCINNGMGMEHSYQSAVVVHNQLVGNHEPSKLVTKQLTKWDNEGAEWLAELATNQFVQNTDNIKIPQGKLAAFNCMAMDVYNEASGEDLMGKKLVASVVLVRARQQHRSVCEIIHQHGQFSWTGSKQAVQNFHSISHSVHTHSANMLDAQAYKEAIYVAFYTVVFNGTPLTSANYYHTTSIHTKWDKGMKIVARHGHHVFFEGKPS